jgi:uncharacterized protein YdeI (BOF family)
VNAIVADTMQAAHFTPSAAGPVTHSGNTTFQAWWPPPDSVIPGAVHVSGSMTVNNATDLTFNSSVHVDGSLTVNASGKTIIFKGPVVVSGNINLQNGNIIFEDTVYSGGNITLSGSATADFEDNVRADGDLNLGSGGDVSFGGTIYVGGDLKTSGAREVDISDDVYIGGDLDLAGGSSIVGGQTIVVMGDVTLSGATKLDNDEIPFLLVPTGDFDISGSGYASAAVYAPEADVDLSGATKLYGSIICDTLSLSGSASIEYPDGLGDNPNLPGGGGTTVIDGLSILSWQIT